MTLWFYDGAFAEPNTATAFEDTDSEWYEALSPDNLEVKEPTQKTSAPAVCGAEFAPGTKSKNQHPDNLLAVHALVLDVDYWQGKPAFTEQDLRDRLAGFRFIAWTTFSSTPDTLKWRVVLPLDSPMPPQKFKSLWRKVNEALDGAMAEGSVSDPGRLGFFGTVQSETAKEHYHYFIAAGERLNWVDFELEDSEIGLRKALEPADLSRAPDWSSDEEALRQAKRYFGKVGADVDVGSRHETLLRASCKLWWDWALPSKDAVYAVLSQVNGNFAEPKSDDEVWKEVEAGHERTMGEGRVEQPTHYGSEREPVARATRQGVQDHARSLKRQGREDARAKGRALLAMTNGEAYAEPLEAKALGLGCASEVATVRPREQPERLLHRMRISLQVQRKKSTVHPVPTDQELLSKIRWKQNEIRRRLDDRERDRQDQQRRDILTAFEGTRDAGYTAKEYKEFEARGHGDDRWILQHGRSYYFFVAGEYKGPYDEKTAGNFATTLLSPASDRLKLSFVDEKGKVRQRTLDELTREYGTFVNTVEHCMFATQTSFVEENKRLVLTPLKQRTIEPKFVPEVDRWLRLLAREQFERLQLWLASVPSLDRELSALVLVTEPNQGKKLLADGLNRIWQASGCRALEKSQPADYLRSPLMLCDERVPFWWRNDVSARVRELLSENQRVSRVGFTSTDVSGYVRLMFHGNSVASLWRNVEELTNQEREATMHRLFTIDTRGNTEAGEYLQSLGTMHRQFVTHDLIAQHVLYLRDTVSIPTERFVVHDAQKVPENEKQELLMNPDQLNDKTVQRVGSWLFAVLAEKRLPGWGLCCFQGKLYASTTKILAEWEKYSDDGRKIQGKKLTPALLAFCGEVRRLYIEDKGSRQKVNYHEFSLDKFEHFLRENSMPYEDLEDGILEVATRRVAIAKA